MLTAVRVRDLIGKNDFFVQQSGAFPQKFTGTSMPRIRITSASDVSTLHYLWSCLAA